jgi:hypothetical protein
MSVRNCSLRHSSSLARCGTRWRRGSRRDWCNC